MFTNKKIHLFFKDALFLDTGIVFLGNIIACIFSFLYYLISARMLSFEDYGTFNTLISFLTFTLIAISPLFNSFTRYFTEYIINKDYSTLAATFVEIIKRLFLGGFIIFLLFFGFSYFLADFFKARHIYFIASAGIIVISLFSLPFISLILSFQRFKSYAFVFAASSLGKLIIGGGLMYFGWKVLGGLLGFLFGSLLIILFTLFIIPDIFKKEIKHITKETTAAINLVPIYKYLFPTFTARIAFVFLISADIILVKHFFSPLDTGYYSIAQLIGKITFFLSSALALVIFPKGTEAFVSNRLSLKLLYKFIFLGFICCFTTIVLTFMFPNDLLKVLVGKANPVSISLLNLLSLSMGFSALLWITINFSLAIHNFKFIIPLLFLAIFEVVFIYNYHPTLMAVAYTFLAFSVISFLLIFMIIKTTTTVKIETSI